MHDLHVPFQIHFRISIAMYEVAIAFSPCFLENKKKTHAITIIVYELEIQIYLVCYDKTG